MDVSGHLRCEAVPLDHILEVAKELVLEGGFMKLLANEHTCLPLIEAEFNLSQMWVVWMLIMSETYHCSHQCNYHEWYGAEALSILNPIVFKSV